ncbi:MAG: lipopolysaccharide biosynthesis protein [Planctomycetota bacterium]|jgi:O-antigen/teichoic acid export membrane protein
MKQSKRIAINTLSSWVGMFANGAVLIFLTKFLLSSLGSEQFGMLRYVITIQGSLLFLDLGLGATLNRFVSRFLAIDNLQKLNAAISFVALLFLGLGVVAGLILSCLGFILPNLIIGGSPELYRSGLRLMVCIGGTLAIRFWGYIPKGVLFGSQRYDVVNVILMGSAILRAAVITVLFLVVRSSGLVTIGLCFLGCAIVETVLMWIFAVREYPQMRLSLGKIDKAIVKEVVGFSVWVLLMGVTTMLIVNIPTFFAGKLYGAEYVAFLSLTVLVLSQIQRISGGFAFVLIPVAGTYGALEDQNVLKDIMVRGTKFCAMMCFPIGVIAVIFGQSLFEWFKDGFGWTWPLLAIMMFPLLLRTTQRVLFSVLMGAGSVKGLALGQLVLVVVMVLLSWLFAVYFNMKLYGIALGSAVPMFLFSVTFRPAYACRQIGMNWLSYLARAYGRVLLCTLPSAVAGLVLVRVIYPEGLFMICIEGLLCLGLFAVCAWRFALTVTERDQVLALFCRSVVQSEVPDSTSEEEQVR